MNLWLHSRHTSSNEGNDTYLMSNMCYLTVTLIFWWLLSDYWPLLVVTARYRLLLLVPSFSMNGKKNSQNIYKPPKNYLI